MERAAYTDRLIGSYRQYYDVCRPGADAPEEMCVRCDFHMTDASYILTKKNVLWSADSHEYCYIFSLDHLRADDYRRLENYVYEDGMKRISPGKGHRCTNLTLIVVCRTCDADARRALRRCRLHKDFRFSLDGWMDFHTALTELQTSKVCTNYSGHKNAGILKKILNIKPEGETENEYCMDTVDRNRSAGLRLSFLRSLARKDLGRRSDAKNAV